MVEWIADGFCWCTDYGKAENAAERQMGIERITILLINYKIIYYYMVNLLYYFIFLLFFYCILTVSMLREREAIINNSETGLRKNNT